MSGIVETAVVPEVTKGLLGLLCSRSTYDFFFKWELDTDLLDKLKMQVESAQALWNVAATKLIENNPPAHRWLENVRYVILDAEDLMDKISTDVLKVQVDRSGTPNTLSEKLRFTGKCVVEKLEYKRKDILRTIHPYKKTREAQMIEIIQKLKDLAAQKGDLGLEQNVRLTEYRKNRETTSFGDAKRDIIGRSEDMKQILELLNRREGMDDALRVISIVGSGGVGKTTLAKMVYNEFDKSDAAHSEFQEKAWVCVSEVFEISEVINKILESITGKDSKENLQLGQQNLVTVLRNKRFLLVLDDVWMGHGIRDKWETLRDIFSVGASGSRIIVTTRDPKVANLVSNQNDDSSYQYLKNLSDDESWLLFQKHAFRNGDSSAYPRLETIGKKIVGKCLGLPLAIKMLASSLFSEEDENEWNSVFESKIWNLETDILPSLWLSYYHLPQLEKECFAYLSIFPKDYIMFKEEIILLWVAEGFVRKFGKCSSDNTNWEHEARKCFDHLQSTFFIQQKDHEFHNRFVMHDLVHDLAEHVSKGLVVNMEEVNPKSRRLYYSTSEDKRHFNSAVQQATALRTLLILRGEYKHHISNGLFSKFKLLRVLSLKGCFILELPDSIGNMELLKYLNVSETDINCLPSWICNLYNLQILQISHCWRLRSLPTRLFDHCNLRHLIAEGIRLEQMPDGLRRMKNLQTLSQFVIGKGRSKQMREFGDLCDLSGSLSVLKLNHVEDLKDVIAAKFENKEYLDELILKWEKTEDRDTDLDKSVLDAMKPHTKLKKLSLGGYGGENFADWVVRISDLFIDIVSLKLHDCLNCKTLPPLGNLTHLKYLKIGGLYCIESLDSRFNGYGENSFKVLEEMEICGMKVLKTWYPPSGGFNSLKKLSVAECPQLNEITYCFPSLYELSIKDCNKLSQLKMIEGSVPCGDSLRVIEVHGCNGLIEIPSSFVNLVQVHIENCERLVSVPELHHMQDLIIKNNLIPSEAEIRDYIPKEKSSLIVAEVGRMEWSLRLDTLNIEGCVNLDNFKKYLTTLNLTSLPHIVLSRITSLDLLRDVEWPSTLTSLDIGNCNELISIPEQFMRGCSKSLKDLKIYYCRSLTCLPPTLLLAVNLSCLVLYNLEALESLPNGFHNLTSLVTLRIDTCPDLIFPLNGLPDSLETLEISRCYKMPSILEMKLKKLNSLTTLTLAGFDDTFEGGRCLPNSIQHLYIRDFPCLKSLSGEVSRLPHLMVLYVSDCPLLSQESWSNTLQVITEPCRASNGDYEK